MSVEENKAFIRRFNEEVWKGNQTIYDEAYAPDAIIHTPDGPQSPQEVRATINSIREAISDLTFTIDELIGDGDKVVARHTIAGIHTGVFLGAEPTNKQITISVISIYRIIDGKIVDDRFESSSR